MKKVKFTTVKKEGYWEYHLPCGHGLLEESLFYQPFELEEAILEDFQAFLWQTGISYLGNEENSLLYALIIKWLSSSSILGMSTMGFHTAPSESLELAFCQAVPWKFSFEYRIEDIGLCRQYGYQSATEFLEEMNYFFKGSKGYGHQFSLLSTTQVEQFIKTYSSDVSSWSFFLDNNANKVFSILEKEQQRPTIINSLKLAPLIVHIQIGEDEGYLDYVLIQSLFPLEEQLQQLEQVLKEFGRDYEKLVRNLLPINASWKCWTFEEKFRDLWQKALQNSSSPS